MRQYDDDPECVRNRHRVPHRACRDSFPKSTTFDYTSLVRSSKPVVITVAGRNISSDSGGRFYHEVGHTLGID